MDAGVGLPLKDTADIDRTRVRVRHLEALDGTPVLDVKPVLDDVIRER
jgi:tRNA (Thr-GGU) A37 N-methylase